MRPYLALILLASCRGPDRWNAGVSRGDGELEGVKGLDWDTKETTFEVGISGPIWAPEPRRLPLQPPCPPIEASVPPPAPEDGGIPWDTIALLAGGALGYKGSEMGVKRYRQKKAP